MRPWILTPQFTIDLGQPPAERFDVVDAEIISRAADLLRTVRTDLPAKARWVAPLVNVRTGFRFRPEAMAIARATAVDWRWVMVANVLYDLAMAYMGCTTVALCTDDGPVVARNMDWWPEDKLAAASCTFRFVRDGRLEYAIAGWPGSIGVVTGLSARGFAVVLHVVFSQERYRLTGYPVLLFLRRVLERAADFDQAVRMLSEKKLFTSALIAVVGTENRQRVCIERTPSRAALRWGQDGRPLVIANHYVAARRWQKRDLRPEVAELLASTVSRCENLERLAAAGPADASDRPEALLAALTDKGVMQSFTAQQIILHPRRQRIRLYVPRDLLPAPPATVRLTSRREGLNQPFLIELLQTGAGLGLWEAKSRTSDLVAGREAVLEFSTGRQGKDFARTAGDLGATCEVRS